MKAAEAGNEGRVYPVGFGSHHLALSERFDSRWIDETYDMPGLAEGDRYIFTPATGRFEADVEPFGLTVLQPRLQLPNPCLRIRHTLGSRTIRL